MKKFITLTAAMMLGIVAFADDFSLYYDASASSEATKIESVANLKKLTFEDGALIAERKDGTTTSVALSQVRRLYFSIDPAVAVEDIKAEKEDGKPVEVYDLTGRKLNIDLNHSQLPKGIYMVDGKKMLVK